MVKSLKMRVYAYSSSLKSTNNCALNGPDQPRTYSDLRPKHSRSPEKQCEEPEKDVHVSMLYSSSLKSNDENL